MLCPKGQSTFFTAAPEIVLFADIAEYIDDHYVDEHTDSRRERLRRLLQVVRITFFEVV